MLGGRAAEELVCRDTSTGAHDDLERATQTARQMATRFGMSEKLGAATYGRVVTSRFLEGGYGEERDFSEQTAREIDAEVRGTVEEQHRRARALLEARRDVLEAMTRRLLEVETLERPEIEALVGRPIPAEGPGLTVAEDPRTPGAGGRPAD